MRLQKPVVRRPLANGYGRARLSEVLDLFSEDDRLNVYAGELEVRHQARPPLERLGRQTSVSPAHELNNSSNVILSIFRTAIRRESVGTHKG